MPLASTSRVQLRYVAEATFGVTPGAGTTYELRQTGETLDYNIEKVISNEINAYRSVSSMTPVRASAGGAVNGEFQYGEYDRLLASALQNTWAVYGTNGVGTTFTADFTATTITASVAPTGGSAFTTLKRGQYFRLSAGANANNGKLFRVHKTTAPTSTVITLDALTPAVVGTSVAGVSVQTSRLTNGTTQTSWSLEVEASDIAQFLLFKGQTPSRFSLNLATGSLATCSFDFMGALAARGVVTGLPGAVTASLGYSSHSGVSGTNCLMQEGTTPLTSVRSLNFEFNNNLREQEALCRLGSVGIGSGNIDCMVTAEIYFADGTIYDKFVANTNTEFIFSSIDTLGNGYVISMPAANIKSHSVTAGAKDEDLIAQVTFQALRDATNADASLRQLVFVDRFGDAVLP
jgi:hypothetical protein